MFLSRKREALADAIDENDIGAIEGLILDDYHLLNESTVYENPLVYAIEIGHTEAALTFVTYGVGLTAENGGAHNPLITAARVGNNTVLKAIVATNIIPTNWTDEHQKSAMDYVQQQRNQDGIDILGKRVVAHRQEGVRSFCREEALTNS